MESAPLDKQEFLTIIQDPQPEPTEPAKIEVQTSDYKNEKPLKQSFQAYWTLRQASAIVLFGIAIGLLIISKLAPIFFYY